MCVIFTLGTVVLYIVPLKFLLLAWGKDADISTSCHFRDRVLMKVCLNFTVHEGQFTAAVTISKKAVLLLWQ